MLNIPHLTEKIKTLTVAISSDVTPPAQKELFKTYIAGFQAQIDSETEVVNTATELVKSLADQIEEAFCFADLGGVATPAFTNLSADLTTIDISITGESPIDDATDLKKLKKQILELEDNTNFETEVNGTVYKGKYTNSKITNQGLAITGSLQIVLENPIQ